MLLDSDEAPAHCVPLDAANNPRRGPDHCCQSESYCCNGDHLQCGGFDADPE